LIKVFAGALKSSRGGSEEQDGDAINVARVTTKRACLREIVTVMTRFAYFVIVNWLSPAFQEVTCTVGLAELHSALSKTSAERRQESLA